MKGPKTASRNLMKNFKIPVFLNGIFEAKFWTIVWNLQKTFFIGDVDACFT